MLIFSFSESWILVFLQRNNAGSENPSDVFRFLVEERVQCCQTRRVRYNQRVDYCIQLPAPFEAASNRGNGAPTRLQWRPPWPLVTAASGRMNRTCSENNVTPSQLDIKYYVTNCMYYLNVAKMRVFDWNSGVLVKALHWSEMLHLNKYISSCSTFSSANAANESDTFLLFFFITRGATCIWGQA